MEKTKKKMLKMPYNVIVWFKANIFQYLVFSLYSMKLVYETKKSFLANDTGWYQARGTNNEFDRSP